MEGQRISILILYLSYIIIMMAINMKVIYKWCKRGKRNNELNNGDKYEGEFKNNKKEGKGIIYYKNGDKYEGEWENAQIKKKSFFYFW